MLIPGVTAFLGFQLVAVHHRGDALFALGMTLDLYLSVRAVSDNTALALVAALLILGIAVLLSCAVRTSNRSSGSSEGRGYPAFTRPRVGCRGRGRRDLGQDAHRGLGALSPAGALLSRPLCLAHLATRLVRRRGRDPLRDFVGATAS
jgi:hypothetical protein